MRKHHPTLGLIGLLAAMTAPALGAAPLVNGDFSSDLGGWTREGLDLSFSPSPGDVSVTASGEAAIGDNGEIYSALYQGVAADTGIVHLGFDFNNQLSATLPAGTFPDTFFASVYLTADLTLFDLSNPGSYDDAFAILSADSGGIFDVNPDATLGASAKGPAWTHVDYLFSNTSPYLVVAFELSELNFTDADSLALIDNATLGTSAAPLPGSAWLIITGLVALTFRKRRCLARATPKPGSLLHVTPARLRGANRLALSRFGKSGHARRSASPAHSLEPRQAQRHATAY